MFINALKINFHLVLSIFLYQNFSGFILVSLVNRSFKTSIKVHMYAIPYLNNIHLIELNKQKHKKTIIS
jgi:hypothetical protein